ncbi:MAG: tyrosine-type recombinase/integrase [Actinomycetota bacterium]
MEAPQPCSSQPDYPGRAILDRDTLAVDVHRLASTGPVARDRAEIGGEPTLAPSKGKREREVPMPEWVSLELSKVVTPKTGQVFPWRDGGLIHRNYYNNQIWRPAIKLAGMTPGRETGMHQLRHHFAFVMLDGGVSIKAVSEYLGHADPGFTLRIYSHLMPDTGEKARQVMDSGTLRRNLC